MALDKLVDSAQLESDLTSVANAIRAKSGGSGQLAFPSGFVSEIGNIPSGGGPTPEVPTGYTQLEYIESDGQALIDTGNVWGSGKKIEITYCRDATVTEGNYWHPFGAPNCFLQNEGDTSHKAYERATVRINDAGSKTGISTPAAPFTLVVEETQLKWRGYNATWPEYKFLSAAGTAESSDKHLAIFARKKATSGWDYLAVGMMLFRWKMYSNGTLIQDLVPAKRDLDDVIGLYDVVGNTFLTNASGSGAFTGGAL